MIYVDTSVALASILVEERTPPDSLWEQQLFSSRLLEYEVWTRIHSRRLTESHGESARDLLARVAFLELSSPVLARVLEPFPTGVRTLDAIHLASMEFVRGQGQQIELASFDRRLTSAARRLGIPIAAL